MAEMLPHDEILFRHMANTLCPGGKVMSNWDKSVGIMRELKIKQSSQK